MIHEGELPFFPPHEEERIAAMAVAEVSVAIVIRPGPTWDNTVMQINTMHIKTMVGRCP
jgi:hypothetical protein